MYSPPPSLLKNLECQKNLMHRSSRNSIFGFSFTLQIDQIQIQKQILRNTIHRYTHKNTPQLHFRILLYFAEWQIDPAYIGPRLHYGTRPSRLDRCLQQIFYNATMQPLLQFPDQTHRPVIWLFFTVSNCFWQSEMDKASSSSVPQRCKQCDMFLTHRCNWKYQFKIVWFKVGLFEFVFQNVVSFSFCICILVSFNSVFYIMYKIHCLEFWSFINFRE